MIDHHAERDVAIEAALAAGTIHRRWLASGAATAASKLDGTPVTGADLEANDAINAILARRFPDDAILAEESPDDATRLGHRRLWIVDPLDGTRDFLAGTGEFAVHVALTVDGVPAVAAVYLPARDELVHAIAGAGAYRRVGGGDERLRVSAATAVHGLRVGVSRLAPGAVLERVRARAALAPELVAMGASVKLVAVAAGDLDASVTLTDCEREWDTCAPELIVTEAGGAVTDVDGHRLRYNQRDLGRPRGLVASNGRCHAALLRHLREATAP